MIIVNWRDFKRTGERIAAFAKERTDYSSISAWARLKSVAPWRPGLRAVLSRGRSQLNGIFDNVFYQE
jgi:hypothetical protein